MTQKNLLITYAIYYNIYQQANGDKKKIKQALQKNNEIDKNQLFYYNRFSDGERSWDGFLCFSKGEAKAREAYTTHKRATKKFYLYELEPQISSQIKSITLEEILCSEAWFDELIKRMAYLVPFDIEEMQKLPEDYTLQTLWNFEHHLEAQFLFYDGKEFLFSTHKDARLPSSLDYGYSVVIDDNGKYGIIHNKTKLLSGEPEFEWILDCDYHYIKIEGLLSEVQKEPVDTDDFREYLCDIVDLETKDIYTNKALCNSLDSDRCITVDHDKLLRYIIIDTKNKRIEKQSKGYLNIITPIIYMLKPVQSPKTKLWGYIDKVCNEVISPRFKEYGFFNDGYAILKEDGKEFVIDEKGEIVISPLYEVIVHHKDDYFFVKDGKKGAVFKRGEIYIDFFDLKEKHALLGDSYSNFSEEELFEPLLRYLLKRRKSVLHDKLYKMDLKEYVGLFDTFKSQMDLVEAGLWWHPVKVKELPRHYEEMIKKEPYYIIGWSYPASAGMFDLTSELPVMFDKKDGSSLTLGIEMEKLELVKKES